MKMERDEPTIALNRKGDEMESKDVVKYVDGSEVTD